MCTLLVKSKLVVTIHVRSLIRVTAPPVHLDGQLGRKRGAS